MECHLPPSHEHCKQRRPTSMMRKQRSCRRRVLFANVDQLCRIWIWFLFRMSLRILLLGNNCLLMAQLVVRHRCRISSFNLCKGTIEEVYEDGESVFVHWDAIPSVGYPQSRADADFPPNNFNKGNEIGSWRFVVEIDYGIWNILQAFYFSEIIYYNTMNSLNEQQQLWYRVDLGLEPAPTLENYNIHLVSSVTQLASIVQL